MGLALREGIFIFVNMDDLPKCYGHLRSHKEVCRVCYISAQCYGEIVEGVGQSKKVRITNPVKGVLDTKDFHLGYTLASGQVFRWGRDIDGWWKGIAFGTVFHLQQDGNQLRFRASAEKVEKFSEKILASLPYKINLSSLKKFIIESYIESKLLPSHIIPVLPSLIASGAPPSFPPIDPTP